MKTTKTKTPLFDSCKRRSKELQSAKVAARQKANPQPAKQARLTDPPLVKAQAKPSAFVLTLTDEERTSGKSFPQILAARRKRGEKTPSTFTLRGMEYGRCTIGGGQVMTA